MTKSTNKLTQYAHSEARGVIPTTTEDGRLTRTINNLLNNEAKAEIISGKDVDINFTTGKLSEKSEVSYHYVTLAFLFPLDHSDSKVKLTQNYDKRLTNNGKIAVNQGNAKYMKINADGTIDKDSLTGFYADDYIVNDLLALDG